MGIHGFTKLISAKCPDAISKVNFAKYVSKTAAIDISTSLYQFLIAIRDTTTFSNLKNQSGKPTSHISGILSRATKLLEMGIKPVFVFDGEAPKLKDSEIEKRRQKKVEAEQKIEEMDQIIDLAQYKKLKGRTVKVSEEHVDDIKRLLDLMGLPYIQAVSEAEAECASLVKNNICDFVISEDSDTLCYGAPILIRSIDYQSSKPEFVEYNLDVILSGLELTHDQFVELCLLCGCDYIDNIQGIGPITAYKYIKRYGSIAELASARPEYKIDVELYCNIKNWFNEPKTLSGNDYNALKCDIKPIDEALLCKFLVEENNFNEARVKALINRMNEARRKVQQSRLDKFFTRVTVKNTKKTTKKLCK